MAQKSQYDAINASIIEAILHAISEVRFGSIEITVHEGRVTQIERREKIRFSAKQETLLPTVKGSGISKLKQTPES